MSEQHKLTKIILLALIFGALTGWLLFRLQLAIPETTFANFLDTYVINGAIQLLAKIFVNLLKVLIVPLVFFSLICGVCASGSSANLSRMGSRTFFWYLFTTASAITLALVFANITQPGEGAELGKVNEGYQLKETPGLYEVLLNIFPNNIVAAMASADMLQLIVFAILFGLAIQHAGQAGERLHSMLEDINEVVLKMVNLVMKLAPVGVFCLVTHVFATKGIGFILPLLMYFLTVVLCLLLHVTLTYVFLLAYVAKINPIKFLKKMYPAMVFAFSTSSSAATMPVTLRLVEKAIGVRNSVASFTVPLGATLNMDGTAIMQGVATVFIAGAYQVDLSLLDYMTIILTATLASVGTAAVPSAGLITLSIVLLQVGLPTEAIGLILGVDRILDMTRTAVNVTGDATVSTIVAMQENLWSKEIFEKEITEETP